MYVPGAPFPTRGALSATIAGHPEPGGYVHRLQCALALACAALPASAALAQQDYPTKPIRIVIPQPPGGSTDAVARLFARKMTETLGQQIVIDNRAGGGVGGIATQNMVAQANPDGYTVLAIVPNFTFTPALMKDARLRPEDFAPVTLLSRDPYALSVTPALPAKSVKELIALAKAKPGALTYGSGTSGRASCARSV